MSNGNSLTKISQISVRGRSRDERILPFVAHGTYGYVALHSLLGTLRSGQGPRRPRGSFANAHHGRNSRDANPKTGTVSVESDGNGANEHAAIGHPSWSNSGTRWSDPTNSLAIDRGQFERSQRVRGSGLSARNLYKFLCSGDYGGVDRSRVRGPDRRGKACLDRTRTRTTYTQRASKLRCPHRVGGSCRPAHGNPRRAYALCADRWWESNRTTDDGRESDCTNAFMIRTGVVECHRDMG